MQFLLLCLIVPMYLFAQNYVWPTNAAKTLTSSYAESRGGRFHTGIDITTWNKEGYKCFAIDEGYIVRAKTGVYGYGKVIYVQLKDGNIAVYAHLSRFMDSLESFMHEKQRKSLNYEQDVYFKPNQFPVKKGDVVAYTGSTGIGVPHLHFEIRESSEVTTNPLLYYPKFYDRKAPKISSVYLTAMTKESAVDSVSLIKKIYPREISKNKYSIDTVDVKGFVGLSVDVFDPTIPERRIGTGVHSLELFVNDSLYFKSQFDTLSFAQNKYFNLDRNLYLKKMMNKRVQNLFKHSETGLTFIENNKVYIDSNELKHIRIVIHDFKNNRTTVEGILKYNSQKSGNTLPTLSLFEKASLVFSNNFYPKENSLNDTMFVQNEDTINVSYWNKDSLNIYSGKSFEYRSEKKGLFESEYVFEQTLDKSLFPIENYQSDIYMFTPMHMAFNKKLKVTTKDSLAKNIGTFVWNMRKSRWDFERFKTLKSGQKTFREGSIHLYTLIQDSINPTIRFTKWNDTSPYYFVLVDDNLSGIRNDKNFKIWTGEKRIIGEYDFEDDLIKIRKDDLQYGQELRVFLKDNLGNTTERSIFIRKEYEYSKQDSTKVQ